MNKQLSLAIPALALGLCSAHAGLIYDQSPPNDNSSDIINFRVADDFTLIGASVVNNINFWYQAQFQTDLSNLTYAIDANAGGAPGSQLLTNVVTPVTSFDSPNNAFFGTFAVPGLSLGAGTYWLELHAGSTLTDTNGSIAVFWAATADNGSHVALSSASPSAPTDGIFTSGFEQYAFQLDGTGPLSTPPASGVPESSSVLLVAFGLMLIILRKVL